MHACCSIIPPTTKIKPSIIGNSILSLTTKRIAIRFARRKSKPRKPQEQSRSESLSYTFSPKLSFQLTTHYSYAFCLSGTLNQWKARILKYFWALLVLSCLHLHLLRATTRVESPFFCSLQGTDVLAFAQYSNAGVLFASSVIWRTVLISLKYLRTVRPLSVMA